VRVKGKRRRRRKEDYDSPLESLEKLMRAMSVDDGGSCVVGLIRGTSVWMRVTEFTSNCLGRCCVGRYMPSLDPALVEAIAKVKRPGQAGEEGAAENPGQGSWYRLCLEEAFFCVHCLHCLDLHDFEAVGSKISVEECWRRFVQLQPNFLKTYISYQHFRGEGYIVKSGIYYGCTQVLYRAHPTVSHSEYCTLAILQRTEEEGETRDKEIPYEDLQSLVRVSVNVKKKLVLLYIFLPTPDKCGCDVSDVNILQLVEVDEFAVTRWLPGSAPHG